MMYLKKMWAFTAYCVLFAACLVLAIAVFITANSHSVIKNDAILPLFQSVMFHDTFTTRDQQALELHSPEVGQWADSGLIVSPNGFAYAPLGLEMRGNFAELDGFYDMSTTCLQIRIAIIRNGWTPSTLSLWLSYGGETAKIEYIMLQSTCFLNVTAGESTLQQKPIQLSHEQNMIVTICPSGDMNILLDGVFDPINIKMPVPLSGDTIRPYIQLSPNTKLAINHVHVGVIPSM